MITKLLEVDLPKDCCYNIGISSDKKYLIADSNSSKWKEITVKLPKGNWSIYSNPMGKKVILCDNE